MLFLMQLAVNKGKGRLMNVMSVLVIRCGALGDLICSTSVIDAVKRQFGESTVIDYVCSPGPGSLFSLDHRVNKVYGLKHGKVPVWLSTDKRKIVRTSKETAYDILINFGSGKQFKSLVDSIHAKTKVGFHCGKIDIPGGLHMVEGLKCVLRGLIDEDNLTKAAPSIMGSPVAAMKEKYGLKDRYIVLSPSNSHHSRNTMNHRAWRDDHWVELMHMLSEDVQVVLVGSRGEERFFNALKPYPASVVDLVGKTSLADLIGVVDGARGLISTDTGTAHMASATNTDVFALIGPTPAHETGPYQSPINTVHIISKHLPCSPCYKTEVMSNCQDNRCMTEISAIDVYDRVKSSCLV
ncbi:ADP-heptose--LPS heptosyltransferase [Desulfoluna limicola]|uniref:ADP-heptose--LPS heptosyltransferase n=1 Tax=Desulfoluna limicola TaxID=2810562 RepID=A0ABN6F025_9BACT|nr:glycosyltransferase family 9 protein [Desulfoluna limicola]BCS94434.1 ADP-heptose--LPS heptosyltransferase [Desulfoluna limicola]